MRTNSFVALVLCATVPAIAAADPEPDCSALEAAAGAAATALSECLEIGLGECESEEADAQKAKVAAEACREGEPDTAAPEVPEGDPDADATPDIASPTATPPVETRRIAVAFDGFSDAERDAAAFLVKSAVGAANLVDPGEVRAARAFSGMSALDAAAESKLRGDLRADRLLAFQMKPVGATRYISLRVTDADGRTQQRFGEATEATLGEALERLLSGLAPIEAPVPTPTPVVAVAPTPMPAATPGPSPFDESPSVPPPAPEPLTPRSVYVDVNAFGGTKSLSTGDWAPLASHGEVGVMTTVGAGEWPVQAAGDFYHSFASGKVAGVSVRTTTSEAAIGVRGIFPASPLVRPHLGAGLAIITVANTAESGGVVETAGGSGFGFWLGGGVLFRLGNNANLGFQLRYSSAQVQVNDATVEAGGLHAGAMLGVGFGSAAR